MSASYICSLPPTRPPLPPSSGFAAPVTVGGHAENSQDQGAAVVDSNVSNLTTTTLPYFTIPTAAPASDGDGGPGAIECRDVTWAHVGRQVQVAIVPWFMLTVGGLFATIKAKRRVADSRAKLQRFEYGLASSGMGPAMAVLGVHSVQCVTFWLRALNGAVDPIYYALETIGALYIVIDMLAGWAYVVTCGTGPVLVAAFSGPWFLDTLVTTSVIAVTVEGEGVGLTWFSFSFLGALRMRRVVHSLQRLDASGGAGNWRRHIVFHVLSLSLFVFTSAAALMTLEILESPRTEGDINNPAWALFPTLVFVLTTIMTVGSSSLVPKTVLGRLFSMAVVSWGVYHISVRVWPLLRELLMGKNSGTGAFRPLKDRQSRHVVILGTPTGPMLWDFLLETFHPNHFESAVDFNENAPHVVMLLPSARTLAHVRKFLARRESLFFRDRVELLLGDAFCGEDIGRAALVSAERAVVLPNLSIADVDDDDAANMMRTFALNTAVPNLAVTCLVHSSKHDPVISSGSDQNQFVSIDAFKMSMLSLSCMTKGALTLMCNLCKTVGDMEMEGQPWQQEYETSLGLEIYELPLSKSYSGHLFSKVVWDVLKRSADGDVHLIGLIEHQPGGNINQGSVLINPGSDYLIEEWIQISGVFIASDVAAIIQCEAGQDLFHYEPDIEMNHTDSEAETPSAPGTMQSNRSKTASLLSPTATDGSSPSNKDMVMSSLSTFKAKALASTAQKEEKSAMQNYSESMLKIKRRLMTHGLPPDLIVSVAGLMQGPDGKGKKRSRSAPARGVAQDSKLDAQLTESATFLQREKDLQSMGGSNTALESLTHLRQLQLRQEGVEKTVTKPTPPPSSMVKGGGHVLLCIVQSAGNSSKLELSELGPSIGLSHFMRPLRDDRLTDKAHDVNPAVVVLGETLPADWHSVVDVDRVYFVRGSPLVLEDLERVGFRQARAITIVRGHTAKSSQATKVSDARMILASHVIAAQLPQDSQIPVVTDHAFNGTCDFLPMGTLSLREMESVAPTGDSMPSVPSDNVFEGLSFAEMAGSPAAPDELGTVHGPSEENYEELESIDYAHHPRFMRGDMFVTGALTSLVANTLYNGSLIPLVMAIIESSLFLLPLPVEWERRSYAEFSHFLLVERDILSLGIYRSNKAVKENAEGARCANSGPTMYYMYTSPPGFTTRMWRSDRILCVAPVPAE